MTKIYKSSEVEPLLKAISDWRAMSIIHAVYEHKSMRYLELQDKLDMSPTTLSKKTKQLAALGVIRRESEHGAKEVSYVSTETAKRVVEAYHILDKVAQKHAPQR